MNRIVRDHYPVSKLPEDLHEGFGPDDASEVRVTIEVLRPAEPSASDVPVPKPDLFSQFKHLRRSNYSSMKEIVEHVRALRDEWTDRER